MNPESPRARLGRTVVGVLLAAVFVSGVYDLLTLPSAVGPPAVREAAPPPPPRKAVDDALPTINRTRMPGAWEDPAVWELGHVPAGVETAWVAHPLTSRGLVIPAGGVVVVESTVTLTR